MVPVPTPNFPHPPQHESISSSMSWAVERASWAPSEDPLLDDNRQCPRVLRREFSPWLITSSTAVFVLPGARGEGRASPMVARSAAEAIGQAGSSSPQ